MDFVSAALSPAAIMQSKHMSYVEVFATDFIGG